MIQQTASKFDQDLSGLWNGLPAVPWPYFAKPLAINDNEFLVAPQRLSNSKSKGIYKFTIDQKEWTNIVPYPSNFISEFHTAALNNDDPANPIIYICNTKTLVIVNVANKTLKEINYKLAVGAHPRAVYANKQLHLIGGAQSFKHLVFDETKQEFRKMHIFTPREGFSGYRGFSRHSLIYCKSKNCIFMFGGSIQGNTISEFSCSTKKWRVLETGLPTNAAKHLTGCGLVITGDERYIIIVGGINSPKIYVFDVNDYSIKISKIKPANTVWNYCCLIGNHGKNELVADGYIRENYKGGYFMMELVKIIAAYNFVEEIYFLEFGRQNHWKINVSAILSEYE